MTKRWQRFLATCLISLLTVVRVSAGAIEDHYGKWLGAISIPNGPTLSAGVELFARADGMPGANMVSPGQGQFVIPVDRLSATDNRIEFAASTLNIQFNLRAEADALVGEVQQGKMVLPIELKRVSDFGEPVRRQTPVGPFLYQTEEMKVTTSDGGKLAGTLTRPRGNKRVTAVVLLHGTGPSDRDETIAGHRPFAVLADYLTRHGIAVYRYDKRGVMRSTGNYNLLTTAILADDGLAAIKALHARNDISRVGVIGHSAGGLLAAMIAADHPKDIDFLVSLAGPGLKGYDLLVLQDRVGFERRNLSHADVDTLTNYGQHFYQTVIAHESLDDRAEALGTLFDGLSEADRKLVRQFASRGSLNLQQAGLPSEREVLLSDAPSYWLRVKCAALILNGMLDVQVPAEQNLGAIRSALAAAGNKRAQFESFPELNHLFQTANSGLESEYASLEETIAPAVLQRVTTFINDEH